MKEQDNIQDNGRRGIIKNVTFAKAQQIFESDVKYFK